MQKVIVSILKVRRDDDDITEFAIGLLAHEVHK